MRDYLACNRRTYHEEQKPRNTLLPCLKSVRLHIRLIGRQDSCHLFDILRNLFLQDIDNVIDGDDTDETTFIINDRHCRKVVFLEHSGNFFLVGHRICRYHIFIHEFDNMSIRLVKQKVSKRYRSDQMTSQIKYITRIYCLFINARCPDPVYAFGNRKVFLQVNKLDSHKTSRRILGIPKQMIDISSCFRIGISKKLFDKPRRHLFHKIRRIISHQIINDVGCLTVG